MTAPGPHQLWQAALGELQLQVARPSYQTFLQGTVALGLQEGALVVGTASPFVAEYLERRLYATIQGTVARLAGEPLEVRFQSPATQDTPPAPTPTSLGHSIPGVGASHPQGTPGLGSLHPRYIFDTFIVGPSNALSHAAATAAARHPGAKYNPLFIYSDVGLGKTHLLQAIAHDLRGQDRAAVYQTSEQFTNAFIRAIREGQMSAFRERYQAADALLIDDIQFLCGKEQTQEGFFHLFNELYQAGRQVVISCDRPPAGLTPVAERLRSRFAAGLVTDIQPPLRETREAILRAKEAHLPVRVPDEVISLLSEPDAPSVREMESRLLRVAAWAELTGQPVSAGLASQALAHLPSPQEVQPPTAQAVLTAVARHYRISQSSLTGRARDRHTSLARRVAIYLLWEASHMAPTSIARVVGGRDPSSVHQAHSLIGTRLSTDSSLQSDLTGLQSQLDLPSPA